jgi:hypothetical protein
MTREMRRRLYLDLSLVANGTQNLEAILQSVSGNHKSQGTAFCKKSTHSTEAFTLITFVSKGRTAYPDYIGRKQNGKPLEARLQTCFSPGWYSQATVANQSKLALTSTSRTVFVGRL